MRLPSGRRQPVIQVGLARRNCGRQPSLYSRLLKRLADACGKLEGTYRRVVERVCDTVPALFAPASTFF